MWMILVEKIKRFLKDKKGFVVAMSFTYVDLLDFACCNTDKRFSCFDTVLKNDLTSKLQYIQL